MILTSSLTTVQGLLIRQRLCIDEMLSYRISPTYKYNKDLVNTQLRMQRHNETFKSLGIKS